MTDTKNTYLDLPPEFVIAEEFAFMELAEALYRYIRVVNADLNATQQDDIYQKVVDTMIKYTEPYEKGVPA